MSAVATPLFLIVPPKAKVTIEIRTIAMMLSQVSRLIEQLESDREALHENLSDALRDDPYAEITLARLMRECGEAAEVIMR